MLLILLIVQVLVLLAVLALWLQKPRQPAADPRHDRVPDQLTALHARHEHLDTNLRHGLSTLGDTHARSAGDLRTEVAATLQRMAADNDRAATSLRQEVLASVETLGGAIKGELARFREEYAAAAGKLSSEGSASARTLHESVRNQHDALLQRLAASALESRQQGDEAREALQRRLNELAERSQAASERLVGTVQDRLDTLTTANTGKLEEIRVTVDEKLNTTLQNRLTESFGQVTTHLGEVQKGLGEMKELATGVGDLKKVLSNVSRRGNVGEFLVEQQLRQMFSPEQYARQVQIKTHSNEKVDFALKIPGSEPGEHILLPIDSKFPTSDWERLEHSYEHGSAEEIATAGKAFERSIREEAKKICSKYIDPPTTMRHAIMVLSTEGLYAEVVRRPGLVSEIQNECRVTIAGPSTFMAILTSFQLGFHSIKLEKKGHEIRNVLERAKSEFDKFGGLMEKVSKQVNTVQNTLGEISRKTKTINSSLKTIGSPDASEEDPFALDVALGGLQLAASGEEEATS